MLVERHDAFFINPEYPVGHEYGSKNGSYVIVDIKPGSSFAGAEVKTSVAMNDSKVFAIQFGTTSSSIPIKPCSPFCNPGRGVYEGLKRVSIQLRAGETFGGIVQPKPLKIYSFSKERRLSPAHTKFQSLIARL